MKTPNLLAVGLVVGLGTAAAAQEVAFADIDANNDGVLSSSEFMATFSQANTTDFSALDLDGDGYVTQGEAAGTQEISFSDADADGDGVLTGDELDHFSPAAQAALMRFDADGDGFVTLNEVRSSDDPVGERGHGQDRSADARDRDRSNQGNGNGGERRNQGNGNGQRG